MNWKPVKGYEGYYEVSDTGLVSMYKSACEASRQTGIGRSIISQCLNHRVLTAGGYLWGKVEECNDYSRLGSTTEDELPLEAQEPLYAEDIVCADRNI